MSSMKEACENPIPPEGSCHFYVERKKRFCRFLPAKNSKYCAEHATLYEPDLGKKRILCPYNPKHTCYETKLNHHMKKCPSRPRQMPPYYMEGVNSGDSGGEVIPDPKATVVSEPVDVTEKIIEKIERLHKEYIGNIKEEILSHPCLIEELQKKDYGTSALRQRKQQASLIGQMDRCGMLKDGTCFVEMGAGKGQMSHWLHSAVQDKKNIGFVLIERSHVRNKMDNLHKEEEAGHVMERVRIDIEHLRLGKISTIGEHDRQIVAFGKHLCGGATDLALRCVVETLHNIYTGTTADNETSESQHKRLKSDKNSLAGVCIAVCCHHRCSWTPYVGKPFFKLCGLSAKDFQIISSMSSWATCAWKGWSYEKKCEKQKRDERLVDVEKNIVVNDADIISGNQPVSDGLVSNTDTQDQNNANTDIAKDGYIQTEAPDTSMHENYEKKGKTSQENGITQIEEPVIFKKGKSKKPGQIDNIDEEHEPAEDLYSSRIQDKLSQEEREKIGRKCKQLIDYGRVQYLQDHNLSSHLKIYIDDFYTPENIVLLATS